MGTCQWVSPLRGFGNLGDLNRGLARKRATPTAIHVPPLRGYNTQLRPLTQTHRHQISAPELEKTDDLSVLSTVRCGVVIPRFKKIGLLVKLRCSLQQRIGDSQNRQ